MRLFDVLPLDGLMSRVPGVSRLIHKVTRWRSAGNRGFEMIAWLERGIGGEG